MPTQKSFEKDSEFPPLEAGKLRLYSMRFCPYAQRSRLVLSHKKIPHETINVDLKEKPAWFVERNPLGLVPVLEQDDKIIYESLITCDYLDEVYPNNKLNSEDPYRRARDRIILEQNAKVVTEYYKLLRCGADDKDILESYRSKVEPLEKALKERGNFFGGNSVCMVDYMIWPWFERLPVTASMSETGVDILPDDKFPNINSWMKRMLELEPVKETMFDAESHLEFYKSYAMGKPNYNYGLKE